LALAHASEGGKCNGVGKVALLGQQKAGGSEYLELHGAFSIALRAPGAALLSKVWFPCLARQRMNYFQGRRCGQEQARWEGGEGHALVAAARGAPSQQK
jgi:hypothetical protein